MLSEYNYIRDISIDADFPACIENDDLRERLFREFCLPQVDEDDEECLDFEDPIPAPADLVEAPQALSDSYGTEYSPSSLPVSEVPLRPAYLTGPEVIKFCYGISYAMSKGVLMNTLLTINWSDMELRESEGTAVLGKYFHRAKKWRRVGTEPRQRRVANPRVGGELHYALVHENDSKRGFHTHVLFYLPDEDRDAFEAWSRKCLRDIVGRPFPPAAFHLTRSYAKTESDRIEWVWHRFRYLIKQLPDIWRLPWNDPKKGIQWICMRDVLKPRRIRLDSPPLRLKRLSYVSQNIGSTAQRRDGYVVPWSAPYYSGIYSGDEFYEWRRRDQYERRQKEVQELIKTLQI